MIKKHVEYCYFWFHSEVKFFTRFRHFFGLIVILSYFNAISVDFYAVKGLILGLMDVYETW